MTHLRKMMLEELERRNYSAGTTRRYLRFVERFAQHFHKSPDKLGPDQLRSYQAYLLTELKLCPGSVENHVAALRFFFVRTLHRHEFREYLPYPKTRKKLPNILSQEEVARLINASSSLFQRYPADGALRNRHAPLRTSPAEDRPHRQLSDSCYRSFNYQWKVQSEFCCTCAVARVCSACLSRCSR